MTHAILENGLATTPGEITVYNYAASSGEYLGSNIEYVPVGVGLPALSTDMQPPVNQKGKVIVWQGGWVLMDDFRGMTVYSVTDSASSIVDYPGPVAEGYTTLRPATHFDKWSGHEWVTDTDAQQIARTEAASVKKSILLAEASAIIAPLYDAATGGYIDDIDKPVLLAWQKYHYDVTKVDVANPVWPGKPPE